VPRRKPGRHATFERRQNLLQDGRTGWQPQYGIVENAGALLAEQIFRMFVEGLEEVHVRIDPRAKSSPEHLVAKPVGEWRDAASSVPKDRALRQDIRGILEFDAFWNSYRLIVTVKSQSMTLTQHRSEARSLKGTEPVANPQGPALKHLAAVGMPPAVVRPVDARRSRRSSVLAS